MINQPESIQLEYVSCPLGCAPNDEIILTGRDLLHDLEGEFTVVRCKGCGLMRTNPRPDPESMANYYPDDYGPYLGTRVCQSDKKPASLIKNMLKPLVNRIIDFKIQPLPHLTPGRLLEVGCASGAFLHNMAEQGWKVHGIEFSASAAETANQLGYPVYVGSLESAPTPEEPFDLIVGWMVLEHLHNPIYGLRKLRDCAKSGAWLVMSIPNAGSLEFRVFKEKWYALQLPTHLHHFTPKTLEKVLDAGGWEIVKIHHQRILSNLIASIGYVLRDKGFPAIGNKLISLPENAGMWMKISYPIAWFLSLFGQTGRMTVWARVK